MSNWGGKRKNQTGRPKQEKTREQHQIRAFADEWTLIQAFARMVKHGQRDECEKFINQYTE